MVIFLDTALVVSSVASSTWCPFIKLGVLAGIKGGISDFEVFIQPLEKSVNKPSVERKSSNVVSHLCLLVNWRKDHVDHQHPAQSCWLLLHKASPLLRL